MGSILWGTWIPSGGRSFSIGKRFPFGTMVLFDGNREERPRVDGEPKVRNDRCLVSKVLDLHRCVPNESSRSGRSGEESRGEPKKLLVGSNQQPRSQRAIARTRKRIPSSKRSQFPLGKRYRSSKDGEELRHALSDRERAARLLSSRHEGAFHSARSFRRATSFQPTRDRHLREKSVSELSPRALSCIEPSRDVLGFRTKQIRCENSSIVSWVRRGRFNILSTVATMQEEARRVQTRRSIRGFRTKRRRFLRTKNARSIRRRIGSDARSRT